MKTIFFNRTLALILAVIMAVSMFPVGVFAEGNETDVPENSNAVPQAVARGESNELTLLGSTLLSDLPTVNDILTEGEQFVDNGILYQYSSQGIICCGYYKPEYPTENDYPADVTIPAKFTINNSETNVTGFAERAFYENNGDTHLETLVIEGNVTLSPDSGNIGVFDSCSSLRTVTFNGSSVDIGFNSFYGCANLESVTVNASALVIRDQAFNGCTSLETFKAGYEPTIYGDPFKNTTFTADDIVVLYPSVGLTSSQAEDVDLNSLLTNAVIIVDGETLTNDTWTVRADEKYTISLRFAESTNLQFPDDVTDHAKMYYYLPAGFTADAVSGSFNVKIGSHVVENNPYTITYDESAQKYKLEIDWNWDDPDIEYLLASNNAVIKVNIIGTIDTEVQTITFSDTVEKTVEVDNTSNVSISKAGYYDSNAQKIIYTVTVNAKGTPENVKVNDVISGNAVIMREDDIVSMTRNGTTTVIEKNSDGKGFSCNIGNMSNGEMIQFTYSASVDPDLLSKSGAVTFDDTGNTVRVTSDNDGNPDDDESTHYEHWIEVNSSIKKNSTEISELKTDDNGNQYKEVKWRIVANPEKLVSLKGSFIRDTIADGSKGFTSYSGEGIYVSVNGESPVLKTWTELGVNTTSDKTWTYNITEDGKNSYEITYITRVEITDTTQDIYAVNNVEGKPGSDMGTAYVHKKDESAAGPTVSKVHTAVDTTDNNGYITWKISVEIPKEGYNSFYIKDTFPYDLSQNYLVDVLREGSIQVDGLVEGESYIPSTLKERTYYDSGFGSDVEYETGVRIDFYKGEDENNEKISGLKNTDSSRIITITLTTNINQTWLDDPNSGVYPHENKVDVYADDYHSWDTERVVPRKQGISKTAADPFTITAADGIDYPVYKYQITIEGANSKSPVIHDTFDTRAFKLWDGMYVNSGVYGEHWEKVNNGLALGSANSSFSDSNETVKNKSGYISISSTSDGLDFDLTDLPKTDSGTYFSYYRITYYLIPKNEDALNYMRELAVAESGTAAFENTVEMNGSSSSAEVTYSYQPMAKSAVQNSDGSFTYTIVLNRDKRTLNGGRSMVMRDTYENMTVDYLSVQVATDPAEKASEITWDYSGNVGTFSNIPDATKVTITYVARPLGSGNVTMKNTAEMKGFSTSSTTNTTVNASIEGSAAVGELKILKYAKGDMTVPLAGAKFALYANKNVASPMKYLAGVRSGQDIVFTTGENGIARVFLDYSQDGVSLDVNYIDDNGVEHPGTTYYLKEIEAPAGYQLDDTWYSFKLTQIPGNVNYGENGEYVYFNEDILKIWNKPESGIRIKKTVFGPDTLTADEKANISFLVEGPNGYTKTLTYDQFVSGYYKLPDGSDTQTHLSTGTYTVTEIINGGLQPETTTVKIDKERTVTGKSATVVITEADILGNIDHTVSFTNIYQTAEITVIKTDIDGNTLSGAEFLLQKKGDNGVYSPLVNSSLINGQFTITDANKDTGVTISGLLDGEYKLEEIEAPTNEYILLSKEIYFSVNDGVVSFTNGTDFDDGIITLSGSTFTIMNLKTELTVRKEWIDGETKHSPIMVNLLRKPKAGGDWGYYEYNRELNNSNSWTYSWEGLDDSYDYKVEESQVPQGYSVSYSTDGENWASVGDTITVTNTKQTTGIAVRKEWNVENDNDIHDVTVHLLKANTLITDEDAVTLTLTFESQYNPGTYALNNHKITVKKNTEVKISVNNYLNDTLQDYSNNGFAVVTENYQTWLKSSSVTNSGTIYLKAGEYTPEIIYTEAVTPDLNSGTEVTGGTATLSSPTWYHEWENLENGYYYIVEENSDGYSVSYDRNGIKTGLITITNSKFTPRPGSLKITKAVKVNSTDVTEANRTWADGTYTFKIYDSTGNTEVTKKANGTTDIGTLQITVTNGVSNPVELVVDGLAPGTYVVKEIAPAGDYHITLDPSEKTVVVSAGDTSGVQTAAFTNNYETTSVELTKTWDDSVDLTQRPTADKFLAGVHLKVGSDTITSSTPGYFAMETTVVDNNNGTYTVTWSNLPKYKNGSEISYTVTEDEDLSEYYTAGTPAYNTTTGKWEVTNIRKTGSLKIIKTLTLSDNGTKPDPAKKYYFTVFDGTKYYYLENGTLKSSTTEQTVEVTSDDNTGVTLTGLPTGNYTVTEVDPKADISGYTLKSTVYEVGTEKTQTVSVVTAADPALINVTNIYEPNPGSLTLTKTVTTGSNASGKTFTFLVDLTPPSDITLVPSTLTVNGTAIASNAYTPASPEKGAKVTLTVTVTGTEPATIGNIPAGTTYTVTEQEQTGWMQEGDIQYSDSGKQIAPGETTDTVTINNRQLGSLKIKKSVKLNNDNTTSTLVDGTYTFTIKGTNGAANAAVEKTVTITIVNGNAASATVKDTASTKEATSLTPDSGWVTIENLIPGDYTVTETTPTNGSTLGKIEVNGTSVTITNNGTSVDVAANNSAKQVEFTNIRYAVKLPATGGAGTAMYTTTGSAMAFGAALIALLRRKRRKAET